VIPLRDANPTRRTPVITLTIIVLCTLVFGWEVGLLVSGGDAALDAFVTQWGVIPANVSAAIEQRQLASMAILTLVTSQFLHGSWLHLGGNLLFLWIFGNNIEDRMGPALFLAFYLVGGVVAGLTQVAIDPTATAPLIGASGAIAAALGAYLVLFPRARIQSLVFLGFFYQLIAVPAIFVLGFWFALQLIDGVAGLGSSAAGQPGVAFFAHIGGFLFGVLVALAIRRFGGYARRMPEAPPLPG